MSHLSNLQRVTDQLVEAGAPGAAARIDLEMGAMMAASGTADLRTGRPMMSDLNFRVGSVTKSFVAALVLKLVSEGIVDLSDTVGRWLPGILSYGDRVTVKQLLNHTAGVPQFTDIVWRELYASPSGRFRRWSPRELVALVAAEPLDFPPGSAWPYSNTGYVLLGLIVEGATEATLESELDNRIFDPFELHQTSLPIAVLDIPDPAARGYIPPLGPELEVVEGPLQDFTEQDPSYTWASGAAVSNLGNLTRFFRVLLGGGFLPSEMMSELLTTVDVPQDSIPLPLLDRYGLGVVELDVPSGVLVGHAGGLPGFLNMTLSTRNGGRQLAVMVNVGDRAPAQLIDVFIMKLRELGNRLLSLGTSIGRL